MEKSQIRFRVRENSPGGWQRFLAPPLKCFRFNCHYTSWREWLNMGLLKVQGWSQGSRSLHLSKGCFFLQDHTSPSTRKALSRKPSIHSCRIDGDNLNPMLSEKACVQGSKIHNCFIQLQGRHSLGLKTVSHINGRHQFKYPNHGCFCYKNCHSINLCESSEKHHLVRYHGSSFNV